MVQLLTALMAVPGFGASTSGAPSGAIFTTDENGTRVNQNIYDDKRDVYLDGDPGPNAKCLVWARGRGDDVQILPRSTGDPAWHPLNICIIYMSVMSTKTVALDEEAYSALKRVKKPDESFSDAVKRVIAPRRPLSDFVGIWKDIPNADFEAFEKWRGESRAADVERQRKLVRKAR